MKKVLVVNRTLVMIVVMVAAVAATIAFGIVAENVERPQFYTTSDQSTIAVIERFGNADSRVTSGERVLAQQSIIEDGSVVGQLFTYATIKWSPWRITFWVLVCFTTLFASSVVLPCLWSQYKLEATKLKAILEQ